MKTIFNKILVRTLTVALLVAGVADASGQKKKTKASPVTSADVRRQQQAAEREITDTRKAIRENDGNIRKGLSDLENIQTEIGGIERKVDMLGKELKGINANITVLERSIAQNQKELQKLRNEYLKAVKKMRVARKQTGELAYIFSAESFSQGMRRMRYLREFARWRDKQTRAIDVKVKELQRQQSQLASHRRAKDNTMRQEQQARAKLRSDYTRKDALVAELKRNGDALRTHLAQKQAEANALRNQVSALIASEEAARQQERKKREEQQLAQAAQQPKATPAKPKTATAAQPKKKTETASVQPAKKKDKKKEKKPEKKKEAKPKKKVAQPAQPEAGAPEAGRPSGRDYAAARRRSSRKASGNITENKNANIARPAVPKVERGESTSFERMRGSLPRPVGGHFRLKSAFGRHPLPGLPDVQYDNPGIDIETGAGAQARAVYAGTVSGVYRVPGFGTVVIVSHGNYYTVYGNLASAGVSRGDSVKQGSVVGKVNNDSDNASMGELHFEVWKNRDKLNPMDWIGG